MSPRAISIRAGNSCQERLTRLQHLSAWAAVHPAEWRSEGPLRALEAGASQPTRPLSSDNRLSAGGSPPPYSIQIHNAAEPEGSNRIWFVCWLVPKKKFPHTRRVSPFLASLFLCQPLVFFEQMQKASSKKDHTKKRSAEKKEGKRKKKSQTEKVRASCLEVDKKRIRVIKGFGSQYVLCLVWVCFWMNQGGRPRCMWLRWRPSITARLLLCRMRVKTWNETSGECQAFASAPSISKDKQGWAADSELRWGAPHHTISLRSSFLPHVLFCVLLPCGQLWLSK